MPLNAESVPRSGPPKLTEDEADAVVSHRRLREKRYSLEEVLRQASHGVGR